jgi:type VI secretion system protein ImpM
VDSGDGAIAGWYGKIPNLGDFASRRLPQRFIAQWDDWLQTALAGSRALIGESWLDVYLTSPVWRFLLLPSVCGESAWAGVLMPSVDRVGRYFPLTIAAEIATLPSSESDLGALSNWLERAETAALGALDPDRNADDLDQTLIETCPPTFSGGGDLEKVQSQLADRLGSLDGGPSVLSLDSVESFAPLVAGAGIRSLLGTTSGKSLWWSRNREGATPMLFCCSGLPGSDYFAMLLQGNISGQELTAHP